MVNITDNATDFLFLRCRESKVSTIFWTCFSLSTFLFGFPGAIAVLLDLFQKARKGTTLSPNDVFLLNVTVLDGAYLLFLQVELYNYLFEPNKALTTLAHFLYSFNLCARPLFITCICLDCYVAVVHPVTYRSRKSLTPRVLLAAGVWIVTVAYGCCLLTLPDGALSDFSVIVFFILTLPAIVFFDISILRTLRKPSPSGKDNNPLKKKAMQIVLNNLIITVVAYFPPVITITVSFCMDLDERIIRCLLVPLMRTTSVPNVVSIMLHLNNLRRLDWMKFWRRK